MLRIESRPLLVLRKRDGSIKVQCGRFVHIVIIFNENSKKLLNHVINTDKLMGLFKIQPLSLFLFSYKISVLGQHPSFSNSLFKS